MAGLSPHWNWFECNRKVQRNCCLKFPSQCDLCDYCVLHMWCMGEHTKAEHRGVARRMVYIPVHTIDRQLNGPNIGLVRLNFSEQSTWKVRPPQSYQKWLEFLKLINYPSESYVRKWSSKLSVKLHWLLMTKSI